MMMTTATVTIKLQQNRIEWRNVRSSGRKKKWKIQLTVLETSETRMKRRWSPGARRKEEENVEN